jgi:hypothetical protein
MKNSVKILILSVLSYQGFAQSKIDMRANDILINRPLRIDQSGSPFALVVQSPANTNSIISFIEGNVTVASLRREYNKLKFFCEGGIDFNFGFLPTTTTAITETGIKTDGSLQSKDLGFTTTNNAQLKPVFADKDGKLIVDNAFNHYQSYNFTAVQAQDWDDQLRKGSGFAWFNSTNAPKTMYLPVNLPDGVKVTGVTVHYIDDSASSLDFTFNANSNATNTFTTICSGSSILSDDTIRSSFSAANAVINNQVNSYYVNISSGGGSWVGNNLRFHSLVIHYQYQ